MHILEGGWEKIGDTFAALLEIPAADRVAELEKLRAQDPAFADEISSLLAANCGAEAYFEENVPKLFASFAPNFDLKVGDELLHFRILKVLGVGSLATVYLAHDTELNRRVALKVTVNQSKEARTLANFQLEGIVQVHAEYVVDRQGILLRIICLQLIAGPSLAEIAEQIRASGKLENILQAVERANSSKVDLEPAALAWRQKLTTCSLPEGIVRLGRRIAEILAFTHERGILHLDIKPANILVDPYGRPYLSDFNVSAHVEALAAGDRRGLGGTRNFMAPEQAALFSNERAKPSELDGRTDVFALGKVLQELLGAAHFEQPELTETLARATHELASSRTASATIMAEELGAWLERRFTWRDMPALWKGFSWVTRHPGFAVFAMVALSQFAASIVNIVYNQLQIVSLMSDSQRDLFFRLVAIYNPIVYGVLGFFTAYSIRAVWVRPVSAERARRAFLRFPLVIFLVVSVGWLLGGWFFPYMMDNQPIPLSTGLYWHFGVSFFLAWLMSLTTSLTLVIFAIARSLYPTYWQGIPAIANAELAPLEGINRLLPFMAGLFPLSAVWLLVATQGDITATEYHSFKILILVTVGMGLLNLLLVRKVSDATTRSFAAPKKSRL